MEENFIKQDFTLKLDTDETLTGGSEAKMVYVRSDRVVGEWDATIEADTIVHEVTPDEIALAGLWLFMPTALVGGKIWKGNITRMMLKKAPNDPAWP